VGDDFVGDALGNVEMESAGGFLKDGDGFEDVLLAFFAEAGEVAEFSFACEFLHLLDAAGLEGFPEDGHFLGAE